MQQEEPKSFNTKHLEMTILGWAVTYPDRFYEIQDLKELHFAHPTCAKLFKIMHDLYMEHGAGPLQTPTMIAKALSDKGMREQDSFAFLTELNDYEAGPDAINAIRDEIIQASMRRALSQASGELKTVSEMSDVQAEDLAEQASSIIHEAVSAGSTIKIANMVDEMIEECNRMDQAALGNMREEKGYSTGLSALDHVISGLHGGEMIVLAARPSVGKSAMAATFIHSMLRQSLPGLVITMEMRREEYAMRMICHTSGVNLQQARNRLLSPDDRARYVEHGKAWTSTPWYLYDQGAASIGKISAMARRLYHESKLKWIIIDYLQLMDHNIGRGENTNTAISRTSKGIKNLALQLNVPVIALAQLNRDCDNRENKRPRLSDLRDSGAIEQDADVVIFIYRESVYFKPDEVEEHKYEEWETAELIVGKQRNGPTGTAKVGFYKKSAKFADLPEGSQESEVAEYGLAY